MMRRLDEIRADLAAVLTAADESGGELSEGLLEELDKLEMELPEKLDMCEGFASSCLNQAEDAKKRAAYWAGVAKTRTSQAKRMRARIFDAMQGLGIKKLDTARFALSIRKNAPALRVIDEALLMANLPNQLISVNPEQRSIDKRATLAAMKSGVEFEGAEIETDGFSLSVK